ncbi:MAG: hypothetical protein ACRD2E_04335, partial [Terriglobales bacterium]
ARRRAEQAIAAGDDGGGASYVNPSQIPSVNSASAATAAGAADAAGGNYGDGAYADGGDDGENSLPSMESLLNPGLTDLKHYQYRLDVELVNPDGDLVWISGRGAQALPFAAAGQAVSQSLQPMLSLLGQLTHRTPSGTAKAPGKNGNPR